jgi:hypothetical protein
MEAPFRCLTCATPTHAATRCAVCGSRSFGLARSPFDRIAEVAAERPLAQLISIEDAPSLRRRRWASDG